MHIQAAAVRMIRRAQWFLINLPIVGNGCEGMNGYRRDSVIVCRDSASLMASAVERSAKRQLRWQ